MYNLFKKVTIPNDSYSTMKTYVLSCIMFFIYLNVDDFHSSQKKILCLVSLNKLYIRVNMPRRNKNTK